MKINLDKLINYILIGIAIFYVTNCGKIKEVAIVPDGYISPKEFEYRIKVINLLQETQSLENEIRDFKKKYENDTTRISNFSINETKSFITNAIHRR